MVLLLRLAIGDGGFGLVLAASSCSGSESVSESSTYSLDLGVTPRRPPLNPQKEQEFKQKKSQSSFIFYVMGRMCGNSKTENRHPTVWESTLPVLEYRTFTLFPMHLVAILTAGVLS